MEHKVIINSCFGGYGWSHKGALAVMEKKGIPDLRFFIGKWNSGEHAEREVTRDGFISSEPGDDWAIRVGDTEQEIGWLCNFDRDDADAVSVLEELGSEYCSSKFAHLAVAQFDDRDGIFDYYIDEYDGSEELCTYPYVTEERVLQCSSVEECLDLMRLIGVIRK